MVCLCSANHQAFAQWVGTQARPALGRNLMPLYVTTPGREKYATLFNSFSTLYDDSNICQSLQESLSFQFRAFFEIRDVILLVQSFPGAERAPTSAM